MQLQIVFDFLFTHRSGRRGPAGKDRRVTICLLIIFGKTEDQGEGYDYRNC